MNHFIGREERKRVNKCKWTPSSITHLALVDHALRNLRQASCCSGRNITITKSMIYVEDYHWNSKLVAAQI
jgi:hypothetical protein